MSAEERRFAALAADPKVEAIRFGLVGTSELAIAVRLEDGRWHVVNLEGEAWDVHTTEEIEVFAIPGLSVPLVAPDELGVTVHTVDIDMVGVAKVKRVTPDPTDQAVINNESSIYTFRVKDGEQISIDTGRREFRVSVGRGPAITPVAPQDDLTVAYMAGLERGKELALEPVDDNSDAYGELLAEWSGRRRLYGTHEASHPKLLREAMRQADELGRPLLGDVIQSLVWQDVIARNRAAHLAQHYACCADTPEQPARDWSQIEANIRVHLREFGDYTDQSVHGIDMDVMRALDLLSKRLESAGALGLAFAQRAHELLTAATEYVQAVEDRLAIKSAPENVDHFRAARARVKETYGNLRAVLERKERPS